jgi:hypothetical protein
VIQKLQERHNCSTATSQLSHVLSPKRAPFQTRIDRWPYLRKVPRKRWISHTHPMWLWGHSLFKILSPGPVFYGTKRLLWGPHKQSPSFHSKCMIDKGLIKRGSTIDHWRSQFKRPNYYGPPLTHSFIQISHFVQNTPIQLPINQAHGMKLASHSSFLFPSVRDSFLGYWFRSTRCT